MATAPVASSPQRLKTNIRSAVCLFLASRQKLGHDRDRTGSRVSQGISFPVLLEQQQLLGLTTKMNILSGEKGDKQLDLIISYFYRKCQDDQKGHYLALDMLQLIMRFFPRRMYGWRYTKTSPKPHGKPKQFSNGTS